MFRRYTLLICILPGKNQRKLYPRDDNTNKHLHDVEIRVGDTDALKDIASNNICGTVPNPEPDEENIVIECEMVRKATQSSHLPY